MDFDLRTGTGRIVGVGRGGDKFLLFRTRDGVATEYRRHCHGLHVTRSEFIM